jgi:hypothetical protein
MIKLKERENRDHSFDPAQVCRVLGIDFSSPEAFVRSLPFSGKDSTAGIENELQTVVEGDGYSADLPCFIRESNYYKNIFKRARSGDNDKSIPESLKNFIERNPGKIWENSWVRFDKALLTSYPGHIFSHDLLADKKKPENGRRSDADYFFIKQDEQGEKGRTLVRIPVSYLLKLALADLIGRADEHRGVIKVTGEALMHHYLNDNTSPEMFSFHTVGHGSDRSIGESVAAETMKRFLLTQLLTMHANHVFDLTATGQRVITYFSAHPPVRQKQLNELIPDGFYRELFMSPCLSGWDRGEEKKGYMGLCHRVLSRSQLNAVSKLKAAGIITRNLVVLPNMSNISLANNGTHVSLGSRKLSALLSDEDSGFTAFHEKVMGDLAIKVTEHFLPLFVNTYSAAPYRMDFGDFHPEKILAFLPHELDYTHLRMIWRRWKKKARLKILGKTVTPVGPPWIDRMLSRMFGLKGDAVPDFRLIDYFACLMSTDESPALDGSMENDVGLKKDLADMGVFDTRMPLYLLYRMRKHSDMGFSGFEGRYYSLFDDFKTDLAHAVNLQMLITALCFQYILTGQVSHGDIPDDPFTESERRQIFFGTAIGIPSFYIRKDSPNRFLGRLLESVEKTRSSRRYPGYVRVDNQEYMRGLVRVLKEDAKDLIRVLNLEKTMADLGERLEKRNRHSVAAKLTEGVMNTVRRGSKCRLTDPLKVAAAEFNTAAESYYREDLRKKQIGEALSHLGDEFGRMDLWVNFRETEYRKTLNAILENETPDGFIGRISADFASGEPDGPDIVKLAHLLILSIHLDMKKNESAKPRKTQLALAMTEL